jgi:hypothetical protein
MLSRPVFVKIINIIEPFHTLACYDISISNIDMIEDDTQFWIAV